MTALPATDDDGFLPHAAHWGSFRARARADGGIEVRPHEFDTEPSTLIDNLPGALRHRARIDRPYIRRGWLEGAPREGERRRGVDEYVAVSWEEAERHAADALRRVYAEHGGEAVYGGSYGWGSAGRFHHAQSQIHRFLNTLGGYVRHLTNYSLGAAGILIPHVVGNNGSMIYNGSTWTDLVEHCELMLCFGGISTKNAAVNAGGPIAHLAKERMRQLGAAGCHIVNVSPLRSDLPDAPSEWVAPRPNTDVALMLAMAHELVSAGLVDRDFLDRFTVGFARLEEYILGSVDGVPKTADWAEEITSVPAEDIRRLAREAAQRRTFISVAPAIQRAQYGEQPLWMAIALACMLGGIGRPGEGFSIGLGALGYYGNQPNLVGLPTLPQGRNRVDLSIPVARIADMLLGPGEPYQFNGEDRTYPDIRLVYWAGGNPFHHHQDLFRLHDAFQRPETIIVHEAFWTGTAKHADIVLPATMTVERNDFSGARNEPKIVAMPRIVAPFGEARDDYDIFASLAGHLGVADQFTEGRDEMQWLRHLWDGWRGHVSDDTFRPPAFDDFWAAGHADIPMESGTRSWLDRYREDPDALRLHTPSGRIELFSETIAGFGYDDCPGHPVWLEPDEWLGSGDVAHPLALVSNQPRGKLHSQLDMGATSMRTKTGSRETLTLHPDDAAARAIAEGDAVRVTSARDAAFIAVARISADVRPGVVQAPTGAWFDPDWDSRTCLRGNPNAVTRDRGTSRLAQGCTGQLCAVEVTRVAAAVEDPAEHAPPAVAAVEA